VILPGSENISLPHLYSLTLEGPLKFLNIIEARNIRTLDLNVQGKNVDLNIIRPIIRLSQLTLRSIHLNHQMLPDKKPLHFPNLTTFDLKFMNIEDSLQDYFKTPNLKQLFLAKIRPGASATRLFSNLFSSPGGSKLEALCVSDIPLDENFSADLQHCSRLKSLQIDSLAIKGFITHFLEHLGDTKYIPSLWKLHISYQKYLTQGYGLRHSFPLEQCIPYKDFIEHCTTKRPHLSIISDVTAG
jgi:hypothetical protein